MLKILAVIADCGGLLGFSAGCSVLSIIEVIYYFIMACISKRRKIDHHYKIETLSASTINSIA